MKSEPAPSKILSAKKLLKKVQGDLTWSHIERDTEMPVIRVVSDIGRKTHFIHMPDKLHNKSSDLDFLHELGHATLCETIHPVFATNGQFPQMANKKQFLQLLPALNAASDWYVCHWQRELMQKKMDAQIRESLPIVEEILGKPELPPIEIILDASLIVAEAIVYLNEPIDCDGVLKSIVDTFLSMPPDQPSEENCVLLVNRLMSAYSDMRARLVPDESFSVWEMYQPNSAPQDATA